MAADVSSTSRPSWYKRIADFKIEDLFSRKKGPGPPRTVHVNENLPADYLDPKGKVKAPYIYTSNQVITSKYTIITFVSSPTSEPETPKLTTPSCRAISSSNSAA
jgi:phospholipid-translocating ATPase